MLQIEIYCIEEIELSVNVYKKVETKYCTAVGYCITDLQMGQGSLPLSSLMIRLTELVNLLLMRLATHIHHLSAVLNGAGITLHQYPRFSI